MLTLNSSVKTEKGLLVPLVITIIGIALISVYVGAMLILPAPKPVLNQTVKNSDADTGKLTQLQWPRSQQAAIGMDAAPLIFTSYKEEKPLPIASIAKVITALAVLKQKPLGPGEQGPEITLGPSDVALYNSYKSNGGSVVKVVNGEKITQYQAMQAMLIPSANNMAASLVTWAFGSEQAYVDYANKMVADLGLTNTHVADASGFSPNTVSTAGDLVKLGKLAVQDSVVAQITSQAEADIPAAGKVKTTNAVLGKSGIIGIKTGHTPESGGCFLFAAEAEVSGKKVKVIGAVLAAPTIEEARSTAPAVVQQGFANVVSMNALGINNTVATVTVPWVAEPINVVSEKVLTQTTWKGTPVSLSVDIKLGDKTSGVVGTGKLGTDSTNLMLQEDIPQPSVLWRLTHPLELFTGS